MRRRLKTLFCGVTHEHACGKFETLKRLSDDFEVVALVDDRPRGTRTFLNEALDVDQAVRDGFRVVSEDEAKGISGIDVAFVETANADLMRVAATFIERGIPLHCDKPCGEAREPYRSLVAKCRAANVPFQVGYMYRGNPAVRFAWRFAAAGGLGAVTFVEADMNHDYQGAGDAYAAFVGSFAGGILYNLGCHLVDMALPFVRGELREAHPFLGDAPGDPSGSRTAGAAFLRFDGTDVLLRTSSRMPGGVPCRRLRVDGTNGTLDLCPVERFDGGELTLALTLKDAAGGFAAGRHTVNFGAQTDRYAAQLQELAAVVRGERPNDQDYDRDLRVHEVTLRACGGGHAGRVTLPGGGIGDAALPPYTGRGASPMRPQEALQSPREKRVLLIAGAGTLGEPTYRELLRLGFAVDVVSLESYTSVNRRLSFISARADLPWLERFLDGKRYEAIVDFVHTRDSEELRRRFDLLLDRTDQFVYLSSYRAYADVDSVITESSPQWLEHPANARMLADDDYAVPKARGERDLTARARKNWTIIRPLISFSHFRLDLVTVGAYALLYRTKAGKPILLPAACRDKLAGVGWAGNVGREIAHLVGNPAALGEAFTLGTPEEITWGDVASYYEEFLGARFVWGTIDDYLAFATPNGYMDRQMIECDRGLSRRVDLSKVLRTTGLDPKTFLACREAVVLELATLSERPDLVARFDTPAARAIDAKTDEYFARKGKP